MRKKIKIAIVDDSIVFRAFLRQALSRVHEFEIVEVFDSPITALDKIPNMDLDVVAVDMEMPGMRGNEFIKRLFPKNPRIRTIVISSLSGNVFDAMQAGAVEFVAKPNSSPGYTQDIFIADCVDAIKIAAAVRNKSYPNANRQESAALPPPVLKSGQKLGNVRSLIAIGASTGGTEAILSVLKTFPADMPGVAIVQHMPPGFTKSYADRLDVNCSMHVREAKHGDKLERGVALLAPGGDLQMRVIKQGPIYVIDLKEQGKVSGHCPSVDVLFESVAVAAAKDAIGIILTGMGKDGAEKMKTMKQMGAFTVGQDESSCVVYGMPRAAFEMGAVAKQVPLDRIGQIVLSHLIK
ncbi:MAG: chemotaxis-specific protein-glutamate methyltransferase CheB [Defluviitaleaceae bacterium]|nr:chemotaxis-specific protein-glutamate methyltransferase CheB [Defluviitaleaceae bacterium]